MSNKEKKDQNNVSTENLEQIAGGKVDTTGALFWKHAIVTDDSDGKEVASFWGLDAAEKANDLDKRLNYNRRNTNN